MTKLAGRRLLVVDPHIDTLELLTIAFEAEGATVVTATSALAAITLLNDTPFHGLLSEVVLPDMNGYELLHQLQVTVIPSQPHLTAIAMTGWGRATIGQEVQAAGYAEYFEKPVDLEQLIATLATLTQPAADPQPKSSPSLVCR